MSNITTLNPKSVFSTAGGQLLFEEEVARKKFFELFNRDRPENQALYSADVTDVIDYVKKVRYDLKFERICVAYALFHMIGDSADTDKPPMVSRFGTWDRFWTSFADYLHITTKCLRNWHKAGKGIAYLLNDRGVSQDKLFAPDIVKHLLSNASFINAKVLLSVDTKEVLEHLESDSCKEFKSFVDRCKKAKLSDKVSVTKEKLQTVPLLPPVIIDPTEDLIQKVIHAMGQAKYAHLVPCFEADDLSNVAENFEDLKRGYAAGDEIAFGKPRPSAYIDITQIPQHLGELREYVKRSSEDEALGQVKVGVAVYRIYKDFKSAWSGALGGFKGWCERELEIPSGSVSFLTTIGETAMNYHDQIVLAWTPEDDCVTKIRHLKAALAKHEANQEAVWLNFSKMRYRLFKKYAVSTDAEWVEFMANEETASRNAAINRIKECGWKVPLAPYYAVVAFDKELDSAELRGLALPLHAIKVKKAKQRSA